MKKALTLVLLTVPASCVSRDSPKNEAVHESKAVRPVAALPRDEPPRATVHGGGIVRRLKHLVTLDGYVDCLASRRAFSPDGRLILTLVEPGKVIAWDVETGRKALTLLYQGTVVDPPRFSADGRRILTVTRHAITVWDTEIVGPVTELKDPDGKFLSADISPDGRHVASRRSDGPVVVWDAKTGNRAFSISLRTPAAPGVLFSPDGRHIAIDSDEKGCICDARTGRVVLDLESCRYPSFSADGRRICATDDFGITVWDVANAKIIREFKKEDDEVVFQTRFMPDSERIVSLDKTTRVVYLLDIRTAKRILSLKSATAISREVGCRADSYLVLPSPDGRLILTSGSTDTVARLWDADTGKALAAVTSPQPWLACFSPDGNRIAATSIVGPEERPRATTTVWEIEFSPDEE
jgi:WD40 repeat protein